MFFLQETKIGKVINHLSKKDIAQHAISARCQILTERWLRMIESSLAAAGGPPAVQDASVSSGLQDFEKHILNTKNAQIEQLPPHATPSSSHPSLESNNAQIQQPLLQSTHTISLYPTLGTKDAHIQQFPPHLTPSSSTQIPQESIDAHLQKLTSH